MVAEPERGAAVQSRALDAVQVEKVEEKTGECRVGKTAVVRTNAFVDQRKRKWSHEMARIETESSECFWDLNSWYSSIAVDSIGIGGSRKDFKKEVPYVGADTLSVLWIPTSWVLS